MFFIHSHRFLADMSYGEYLDLLIPTAVNVNQSTNY